MVNSETASFRLTEKKILDSILGEGNGYDSRIRPSGQALNVTGKDVGMYQVAEITVPRVTAENTWSNDQTDQPSSGSTFMSEAYPE